MIDLDTELAGVAAGDPRAFTRWMAGAERPLRESLRRFARNVDTESVIQETLLRVARLGQRCQPDGRPNALLRFALRIARNLAIDELRRQRFEEPISDHEELADAPGPEPALPDPLLRERIVACWRKLSGPSLAALGARLNSRGTATDHDLAARLGMKLNTFLRNVTRGRNALRECLRLAGIEVS